MSILIIGDDNYPTEGLPTIMEDEYFGFEIAAFIPSEISDKINAFRRVISLIYGKKEAERQIKNWMDCQQTGVDVAIDILKKKHVMLVNKTNNCWKIKKFLKENCDYKTVILLGNKAYKLKKALDKLSIDIKILSYPHPSERSAGSIYWRELDYIDYKGKKYDKKEDLVKVFRV